MELDFGILAERAEATQNGPIHLWGAAFESVGITSFPAFYQFAAVVKMRATADDLGRPHHIRMDVTNPAGETKEVMSNPDARMSQPNSPERPYYAMFVMILAFTFMDPGEYTIRFFADGAEVKSWPIFLSQIELPAGVQPACARQKKLSK